MHLSEPSVGLISTNAIVAGHIPMAGGAALSCKFRRTGQVVLCFFGDGASCEGEFFETLNMAMLWRVPLGPDLREQRRRDLGAHLEEPGDARHRRSCARDSVCPPPSSTATTYSPFAMRSRPRSHVRAPTVGPSFVECKTVRWERHSAYSAGGTDQEEQRRRWQRVDPIPRFAARSRRMGCRRRRLLSRPSRRRRRRRWRSFAPPPRPRRCRAPESVFEDLFAPGPAADDARRRRQGRHYAAGRDPGGRLGQPVPRGLRRERSRALGDRARGRGRRTAFGRRSRTSISASSTTAKSARARDVIAEAAGVPEAHVAVGTTHNHSVPVTLELGGAWIRRNRELVEPYVESVFDAIGRAAAEAAAALGPCSRRERHRAVASRGEPPDDEAGRHRGGRPQLGRRRRPHAHRRPARRRRRPPGRDDRPLRLPPDHPRAGQHPRHAGVPGHREARRRGASSAVTASSSRVHAATSGRASCSFPTSPSTGASARCSGHEAAATALRSSWRRHRQRLREGEASAWIASFEYEPDVEPDATVGVAREILPLPLRTTSATRTSGAARRRAGRTRRTPREPRAPRTPRCAS